MTLSFGVALWSAETRKLLSRTSARLGLAIAVVLAVVGPLMLRFFSETDFDLNGSPTAMATFLFPRADTDVSGAQFVTLRLRNHLVLPLFVMWLSASSMAGEFRSGTLREDLIRPVGRGQVLVAKWAALVTWIGLSLALTWVVAAGVGALIFGVEGHWLDLALGYMANLGGDAMLAAMTLLMALIFRSVPGTLVGMFFAWVVGAVSGVALNIFAAVLSSDTAQAQWIEAVNPWLPNQAAFAWVGCASSDPWQWPHFASMALTTGLCLGLASWVFRRLDVP
jgi:ABC-type transport system involved in multi-copper enzyme maturation permease subunit